MRKNGRGSWENLRKDAEAARFLDAEIEHSASVADIAEAAGPSKDLALQVYAAARLIAATPPEKAFLDDLGKAMSLDPALVAQPRLRRRWCRLRIDLSGRLNDGRIAVQGV